MGRINRKREAITDEQAVRDYIGATFISLAELAEYRMKFKAPGMAGAKCPAAEYLFAVSTGGGQTWEKPSREDWDRLLIAIVQRPECCTDRSDMCAAVAIASLPEFEELTEEEMLEWLDPRRYPIGANSSNPET